MKIMQYKLGRKQFLSWLENTKEPNLKNKDQCSEVSYLSSKERLGKSNFSDHSRITLNDVLVGEGPYSRYNHTVIEAVTQTPGEWLNPLYLYGGESEDRQHLICAIINHLLYKNPEYNIGHKSPEEYTEDFITAIRKGDIGTFYKQYLGFDILIINEIQFFMEKAIAIGEFRKIISTRYKADKQIIFTADRHPVKITQSFGSLLNYIGLGRVISIQPDSETGHAILKRNAQSCHSEFSDEVLDYIAYNLPYSSFRQLERTLNKLDTYAVLTKTPIDLSFVKKIMQNFILVRNNHFTLELIKSKTAEHFKLSPDDLTSQNNNEKNIIARQVALYISWELIDIPLSEIGCYFGIKDIEEAIYNCNKIKELIRKDEKIKWNVEKIIDKMAYLGTCYFNHLS